MYILWVKTCTRLVRVICGTANNTRESSRGPREHRQTRTAGEKTGCVHSPCSRPGCLWWALGREFALHFVQGHYYAAARCP